MLLSLHCHKTSLFQACRAIQTSHRHLKSTYMTYKLLQSAQRTTPCAASINSGFGQQTIHAFEDTCVKKCISVGCLPPNHVTHSSPLISPHIPSSGKAQQQRLPSWVTCTCSPKMMVYLHKQHSKYTLCSVHNLMLAV